MDGLQLSRSSVRRLRGPRPARSGTGGRAGTHRWTPEAEMGALVQLDAAPSPGSKTRPALALHGAMTTPPAPVSRWYFRPTEDLHGYATLLHTLCTTAGLPGSLRRSLRRFVRNDPHWTLEEELRDERTTSGDRRSWASGHAATPGEGPHRRLEPEDRVSECAARVAGRGGKPRRAAGPTVLAVSAMRRRWRRRDPRRRRRRRAARGGRRAPARPPPTKPRGGGLRAVS